MLQRHPVVVFYLLALGQSSAGLFAGYPVIFAHPFRRPPQPGETPVPQPISQ